MRREEVLAKRPLRDGLLDVIVGRGNHADIDLDGGRAAQPFELPLLQHAEKLDLRRWVHVADLVQEQRPTIRQFKPSLSCAPCASKRPLFITKQLGPDQRVREGTAADGNKRLRGAKRVLVDGVRDQLLPGARLAADSTVVFVRATCSTCS